MDRLKPTLSGFRWTHPTQCSEYPESDIIEFHLQGFIEWDRYSPSNRRLAPVRISVPLRLQSEGEMAISESHRTLFLEIYDWLCSTMANVGNKEPIGFTPQHVEVVIR